MAFGPSPKRVKKILRVKGWGDVQQKTSSIHEGAVACMSSLQLWLSAQGFHKIRSVSIVSWIEEGYMWPHLFLREYWQLTVPGGRDVIFFNVAATDKLPMFQ